MMKNISALLTILFILFACSTEQKADNSTEINSLRSVSTDIVRAWNEGDYEGFVKYMDDEATLMPQNTSSIKGLEAIRELYKGSFENMEFEVRQTIDEIQVFGDYAYEIGAWEGSIIPKDGSDVVNYNNKTITIYKKDKDGSWKIFRWMYSSNEAL
jgi:uncharacterized protein (TIGR02246 family)